MLLKDALDQIDQLAGDDVVFARKPWLLDSDAVIGKLDARLCVPAEIRSMGFDYFMEVNVAVEVLEVFGAQEPTLEERRALLMFYAEHDSYPEWVYERGSTGSGLNS